MRNAVLGLGVLVGITLAPFTACVQPSISEIEECQRKVFVIQQDLIDFMEFSQGVDRKSVVGLLDIAQEYTNKLMHILDLLRILTLITNDDDLNRVKLYGAFRMNLIAESIDLYLEKVNFDIYHANGQAIISTGNQLKTELRRLQELLSPISRE